MSDELVVQVIRVGVDELAERFGDFGDFGDGGSVGGAKEAVCDRLAEGSFGSSGGGFDARDAPAFTRGIEQVETVEVAMLQRGRRGSLELTWLINDSARVTGGMFSGSLSAANVSRKVRAANSARPAASAGTARRMVMSTLRQQGRGGGGRQ